MAVKIAITGRPGIGKTTAVKRIYKGLGSRAVGFYTEEVREGGRRVGFRIVRSDGKVGTLASTSIESPFRVGKYRVDVKGFERFTVPFLKSFLKSGKVFIIDEVGRMELLSEKFRDFIEELIDSDVSAILTIPNRDIDPTVRKVRESFRVVKLSYSNRDRVPGEILSLFGGEDEKA